jgi:hypothetical protein
MKGPFAETPEAAVEALQAFLEKKGLQKHLLFAVFVAEKMDREVAPCATSTFGYKDAQFNPLTLRKLLETQDLKVGTLFSSKLWEAMCDQMYAVEAKLSRRY